MHVRLDKLASAMGKFQGVQIGTEFCDLAEPLACNVSFGFCPGSDASLLFCALSETRGKWR